MKSQTKPVKSQRQTSNLRVDDNRCGDDIGAKDKNGTNTSLKGKKERMSPRNPYTPMVPLKKEAEFRLESWDDLKDKEFEILITQNLVNEMNWPLKQHEDGTWWVQVPAQNKEKKK